MPRFRFRLEASLQLAEQNLEIAQREFAHEMQLWQACVRACASQQDRYKDAQEGQRVAGKHRPAELGSWQIFALEQRKRLIDRQRELMQQEAVMESARQVLLEAHRDTEKFQRLKEKQAAAFQVEELQKEQKGLDETGQVLHWHRQNLANLATK
ncbi:flagellar export protein FliJ [Desulfosporosinus sp. BICA1-9]|uniref:flagellar export protein FliJ n=1 Tax=Desulfosporosinus sp. BICA1-9 TaxID=1531958 RepID=UPI00054BB2E6|nr:flagellar FliJ family protein [Desulfosporosinus sp. BICA1-9]KJS47740.1 MAG: flagellar export protein FliJ [Peptococcaceae bacterium BRH_c23]KJS90025.1 MAG: flagellar export protein FliJ [Desulfosporosinus sp. BICA1-9]HBW36433.1 flagellar export protein FliJ [Desulfosporosinus sp.]